jgi:hypothetical protein
MVIGFSPFCSSTFFSFCQIWKIPELRCRAFLFTFYMIILEKLLLSLILNAALVLVVLRLIFPT